MTDGCDLLNLGSFAGLESLPSRVGADRAFEKPKSRAECDLSRGWSCRENIQSLISGSSLKAFSPSTASAAAICPPDRTLLVKPDPVTGKMNVEEVLKLLSNEVRSGKRICLTLNALA